MIKVNELINEIRKENEIKTNKDFSLILGYKLSYILSIKYKGTKISEEFIKKLEKNFLICKIQSMN